MRTKTNSTAGTTNAKNKKYMGIHPNHDFRNIPKGKNADMVRLGYANVVGIPPRWTSNYKVNIISHYAWRHDLNGFFGMEMNLNWKWRLKEGQLLELFHAENAIHTISSYNTFENFGQQQQGGPFGLAFGQLASKAQDIGGDDLG
jgi:hypothetical protein